MPPVMPQSPVSRSSGNSSLWALVIILAVVLAAGAYFWSERGTTEMYEADNSSLDAINFQSDSDAEADIEADLNSTDVDNVDYDLDPENFNAS
jgi:hypothetical protein